MDGQIGIRNFVKILPVRAVPDGDERDKDVANAIRYSVRMGAKVISMSFGKAFKSPGYGAVEAAMQFALDRDVVLVHAAGNSSKDLEDPKNGNFPTPISSRTRQHVPHWLEVGANAFSIDNELVAEFSNYGKRTVDLFGPGRDIFSTTPNGTFDTFSGTSMAAPNVAGVAAFIRSQFPKLTAIQVANVLRASVFKPLRDLSVIKPGEDDQSILFSEMSRTGGIVNLEKAMNAAALIK